MIMNDLLRIKTGIVVAVALLSSAFCTQAQILYKITGNGLKEPSYIFGTHHLAPISVIDSVDARRAWSECRQVVGELDMTQDQMAMAAQMQSHMLAPPDSSLSKVLGPEKMAKYAPLFRQYAPMPGLELQMLDAMKPVVVTTMVSLGIVRESMPDFNPGQQLDAYFQTEGKKTGKRIIPLETAAQQAAYLYDSTYIADQAAALCSTLDDIGKAREQANRLNANYMKRDLQALLQFTKDEDSNPRMFETLLYNRNDNWMRLLPGIMQEAPAFIAVGALHLPGERGLLEQLRGMGYTVIPVQ